jgi:glycosyltransferase involved in cell wall biosynthesis
MGRGAVMTVRVALVTPFAPPSIRGNAITVGRIARGLRGRGADIGVWDLSVTPEATIEREITRARPALVHAFHAFRTGPLARRLAERAGIPLVVTITGTDANHDLVDPERAEIVRRVLEAAASVTVFHEFMATRLVAALPGLAARVSVVPQSVFFEDGSDTEAPSADTAQGPSLLFPAGIRAVKNPRVPLAPLDRVAPRYPGLALFYVGPILEANEGDSLLAALRDRPWARYLGPQPHHRMRRLLEHADIVLNCSASEGGMANSVLEALALGRAVLASNIEGNRSLIEDGVTGLLFDTPAELGAKAVQLLADGDLRLRLGAAGREAVAACFGPARELDGYLSVYARLVTAGWRG